MATATATKIRLDANTPAWRMRALQIADRDGLTARWTSAHSGSWRGVETFSVRSRSGADAHTIHCDTHLDFCLTCDCQAAAHGLPCGHIGAVVSFLGTLGNEFGGPWHNPCVQQRRDFLMMRAPDAATLATWRAAAGYR